MPIVPPLGELGPVIKALTALTVAFPMLPGDSLTVGRVLPPTGGAVFGIGVDLHTTFADFETWREALGIDPADVEHRLLETVQTMRAYPVFAGVQIELTAYTPRFPEAE